MAATTAAVVGGVASAASSVSSMQGGGGGTPKWKRKAEKALWPQAQQVAAGMSVAPQNADQLAAAQGVRDSQGYLDSDMAGAQGNAELLAQGLSPEDIRRFYNPYESDVVSGFLGDLQHMRGLNDLAANDLAEKSNAFGGDRDAVYRAVSSGELDRNAMQSIAGLRSSGYDMASRNALQNQQLRLGGNDQLQQLIEARRRSRYDDLGALRTVGLEGQMQDQAQRDLARRRMEFLQGTLAGTPGGNNPAQPNIDPIAAAMHGYQGGYQGVADLLASMRMPGSSGASQAAYKKPGVGPYLPPGS